MGKLYIVPTPIGNLEDITLRALRILKEADFILAEDTRNTVKLLKYFEIDNQLKPYHAFNEHKNLSGFVLQIANSSSVALVSDAGTPGISDPGFLIVRGCVKENIEVECLPGPTAFIPALINSGLPCDRFLFEGFLPHKKGRQTKLEQLSIENKTVVLYESPHRLLKTLKQIKEYFDADRQISVSRELTKIHEETVRGSAEVVLAHYKEKTVKGEIVIVIEGKK